MKKTVLFLVILVTIFVGTINANACSVSDGCKDCYPEAAARSCRQSLNSSTNTTGHSNSTSSTTTKPDTGTSGHSGSTSGGTTIIKPEFDCTKCTTYAKKEDQRQCYVNNGCDLPADFYNNDNGNSGNPIPSVPNDLETDDRKIVDLQGCENIFGRYENGKYTDSNSLGYFLQFIFKIVKYVVPIILIVLTIVDFVSASASGDKDNIKKALQKLYKRAIIAVIIFLLPTLLDLILGIVTEYGTCGIK